MANVLTPYFRVSYPNLFKPKRNDLNGKDEYSLVALFPKDADLSALKAEMQRALTEKWGDKAKTIASSEKFRNPFRDQKERANDDGKLPDGYEAGCLFVNLKSAQKPGLVGPDRQDIIDSADFYAGCWARASVRAFAYDSKGNRGVSFGLQNVQKVKDGDPISGRAKAQDEFAPVEGASAGGAGIFD